MKKSIFYLSLFSLIYMVTFSENLPDYDLWARLAVGSIFFHTGEVLKHDIFSYLPTKVIWVDHEWGSGVVFYFLTRYFGEWGIFALKAFIIFAIFLLIIRISKLQTSHTPGIFYFIFLCFALLPGIASLIRCQIFTYLFFTLWLYLLERIRRGDNKLIWIFPVSMLLWANLHGGFLAGIGLIIIYAIGELLNKQKTIKYFGMLVLVIPVTLINPYGFELWNFIINASFMPRPYIPEWHPISLSGPFHLFKGIKIHILAGFFILTLLTLLAGIKLVREKEKYDWTRILLVVVLLYLGVKHQRHTQFFILAISGLFYHHFVDLFIPIQGLIKKYLNDKAYERWKTIRYSFGYIVLASILIYSVPKLSHSIIVDPQVYPVGSFEFIKQNNISGNLATTYNWGSYAFWKLYPQCKVLIDGRYEEVYPNDVYDVAMKFSERIGEWQEVLRKYHTDIIVLSKRHYSPADVLALTEWKIVYGDISSVVLLPKTTMQTFYIFPNYNYSADSKEDYSKKMY